MSNVPIPDHYTSLQDRFPAVLSALEELGKTARSQGPLDAKTAHLVQLAAAAAIQSEGAVHSHTKRALQAGATRDEVYHTIVLLVSTIGFPKVAAAVSWIDDVLETG